MAADLASGVRCEGPLTHSNRNGDRRIDNPVISILLLKLAAPYIAASLCWCIFKSAWLTILLYHLQILLWSRKQLPQLLRGWRTGSFFVFGLPCVLGGPLVYFLIPYMTNLPLHDWLARYHLTGTSLLIMIPYFGLVHPLLEQAH